MTTFRTFALSNVQPKHVMEANVRDAFIISDLHLGADVCQAKELRDFLENIEHKTSRLILNGDVFDSLDFRRLKKHHWSVLSKIRSLSDQMEIVWLNGNHDGSAEIIAHLLGVDVMNEYVLETGEKRFLVFHGDKFDKCIADHPILSKIGDFFYRLLQRIDSTHYWARVAKHNSKRYLRSRDVIKQAAVQHAKARGLDGAICGHVHMSEADVDVEYYNSGCWTEMPCTYLSVKDGHVEVRQWPRN